MVTLKTSLMSGKLKRLNKSLLTVLMWLFLLCFSNKYLPVSVAAAAAAVQIHSLLLPAVIFVGCDSAP